MASTEHESGNGGTRISEKVDSAHDPTKYMGRVDGILRAMAHPVRRDILLALKGGEELSASQMGKAVGLEESRLPDVAYQVKYLAQKGCIEQTRYVPGKRNTMIRFYRIKDAYAPLLRAIADLEVKIKNEPEPVQVEVAQQQKQDSKPRVNPVPRPGLDDPLNAKTLNQMQRLHLRRPAGCKCTRSIDDGDGYCVNCTKPVAEEAVA